MEDRTMAEDGIDRLIDEILRREGGFVDHPADRGGATKYGITIGALAEWRRRPVAKHEVMDLEVAEARQLYRSRYLEAPGLQAVPDERTLGLLFDCSINHGPGQAARFLQSAIGAKPDGSLGPASQAAIKDVKDWRRVYVRICADRVRYYGRIVANDNTQAAFAAGWANRAAEFIEATP
jgi:lysozyme family protein